ncbi:hypothetical protein PCH70_07720 [Pseudomonas cichorii JBC1]|nr:hypothetical protein PCH70_07720 [Pseudomonas cichorii JBC1]
MRTFGKTLLSLAKLVEPHTGPDPTHVNSTILVLFRQPVA